MRECSSKLKLALRAQDKGTGLDNLVLRLFAKLVPK